jgi:hypothetical protein
MKEILRRQNSRKFLAKFLLLRYQMSLLVIAGELWLMNREGLELRYGRTVDQKMVAVLGTSFAIPPCNSMQTTATRLPVVTTEKLELKMIIRHLQYATVCLTSHTQLNHHQNMSHLHSFPKLRNLTTPADAAYYERIVVLLLVLK